MFKEGDRVKRKDGMPLVGSQMYGKVGRIHHRKDRVICYVTTVHDDHCDSGTVDIELLETANDLGGSLMESLLEKYDLTEEQASQLSNIVEKILDCGKKPMEVLTIVDALVGVFVEPK